LQLGQGGGQVLALLRRHLIEMVAELCEIVGRRLRIAVLVCIGLARCSPRQRPVERGQRRRFCLVARVDLRMERLFDRSETSEIGLQVLGMGTQLSRQVAKVGRELCSRIVRLCTLRLELLGDLVDVIRLLARLVAVRLGRGDRPVLRVRKQDERDDQQRRQQGDGGRAMGEARSEDGRRGNPECGQGIDALASNEPFRFRRIAPFVRPGLGRIRRGRCRTREGGESGGERQRARDAIA